MQDSRSLLLHTLATPGTGDLIGSWLGYTRIKRWVDLALTMALMLLVGPLMLMIACAIAMTSPGPVLFRQKRIGKNGQPFTMLKFRSMHTNCDSKLHADHVQKLIRENTRPEDLGMASLKMAADPRVTKIGKYLRALSLDELPQLLNVLRGEMSLVGPRPPVPYEYDVYEDWHKERLAVLPGITGYWQAFAHNQVSFNEMVQLDLNYIATMSLWLDLWIMIQTPFEMLRGRGAK